MQDYLWVFVDAAKALLGYGDRSDLLQDVIGAQALLQARPPYPVLGPAIATLGVDWPLTATSTHPPTAFLFLVPFAWLPWPTLAQLWACLMLGCYLASAWAYGLSARRAVLLSPLVLWPPALTSLMQLTPLWLLGLALAWRCRRRPGIAGVWIGLAAATKGMPALLVVPFVARKHWAAPLAAAVTLLVALAITARLDGHALPTYLTIGRESTAWEIAREVDGALLPYAAHRYGGAGVAAAACLLVLCVGCALSSRDAPERWAAWTWLSVALLPIAWIYSLLPLLPWLGRAVVRGPWLARVLALVALLLPFLGPVPSKSPEIVALTLVVSGLVVVAEWHPGFVLQRSWLARRTRPPAVQAAADADQLEPPPTHPF